MAPSTPTQAHFSTQARFSTHLYIIRLVQVMLAIAYLVLLTWSTTHKGWWLNIIKPMGLGISAALLTIIAALIQTFTRSIILTNTIHAYLLYLARVLLELVLLILWCASFVTMLLPKGKDFKFAFEKPPYVTWDVAVALACVEIGMFVWSTVLVTREKAQALFQ